MPTKAETYPFVCEATASEEVGPGGQLLYEQRRFHQEAACKNVGKRRSYWEMRSY